MDGLFYLDNTLSYGVENGASLRLDKQSLQASRRETKNTTIAPRKQHNKAKLYVL